MDYHLVRLLRRGSLAEVHEALAAGEGGFVRRVALKRPLVGLERDPAVAAAFAREARVMCHLHHSNVLAALDFGTGHGAPFIALELVEGDSLGSLDAAARALGAAIPVGVALHVSAEVAHGLAYAHSACDASGRPLGLVHRDINPSNILLSWEGDVKIADFGVALAAGLDRTAAGKAKGTLGYMAPEQLKGDHADGRADVYALGCVLHRLIAGRSPLDDDEGRRRIHAGQRFPLDPQVPDALRPLLLRATEADRNRRHRSALDFAAEAGAVRARMAGGDGRSELRDWLGPLRKRTPAAAPARNAAVELLHCSEAPICAEPALREPATAANVLEDSATTQVERQELTPTQEPELFRTASIESPTLPPAAPRFETVTTEAWGLASGASPAAASSSLTPTWPVPRDKGRFVMGLLLLTVSTAWVARELSTLAWSAEPEAAAPPVAAAPVAMVRPAVVELAPQPEPVEAVEAPCATADCNPVLSGAAPSHPSPRRPRPARAARSTEASLGPAESACPAPEVAAARLQAAMNRVRGSIIAPPLPQARALEDAYFDLRERARQAGEPCGELAAAIAAFEQAVNQALAPPSHVR